MTELKTYQAYAKSLHLDIEAAINDGLPRRQVVLEWLDDFLSRAKTRGFQIPRADVDNLIALDQFVRHNGIAATERAALE